MIKHLIPGPLRRLIWFIRKAPQRQWIGKSSLKTDLKGWWAVFRKRKEYNRITICVGVKNRSDNLLNVLIDSMNRTEFRGLIDLAVFDCGSTDHENLFKAITEKWKGLIIYERKEMPFARSVAFNRAVDMAETKHILVCDADMRVPYNIVEKASKYVTKKSAWFPICWYTNPDGSGRYWTESTGMFASYKETFDRIGRFDESIREWGKEDWLLYFEFYKNDIACIRTREPKFIHQYHKSLKPDDFVPLF